MFQRLEVSDVSERYVKKLGEIVLQTKDNATTALREDILEGSSNKAIRVVLGNERCNPNDGVIP